MGPFVHGHCNGILCLADLGGLGNNVSLWNPSTREFKIIPQTTVQRPPGLLDFSTFNSLGFGYDSQTDDFKVVRSVTNYFEENLDEGLMEDWNGQVELYSLKSDSWKEISFTGFYAFDSILFNNYVNGFNYCQAVGVDHHILSFDMINKKFSTSPLPEFSGSLEQYYLDLLDFNGFLGAIFYPREGTDNSFDLWVMNGSWTKQFNVESVLRVERPLEFWKNGELFLESSGQELVLFDSSIQELRNLGIHAYQKTMHITAYVESLVPLKGRSEHEECIIRRPPGGESN
ncbi:Detected protein of unknown function [Hibiscus syriacus]|uniref:F-box associated beta-propeller type 1 domain-containing protein n=1 Tax=Hibiscus syriacus TaxID=106335 RepID=A0A6A2XGR0_HIBSY|nr:Detected protein of unknown function [Hibiscus syriacus]